MFLVVRLGVGWRLTQALKKLRRVVSASPKEVARIIEQSPYFTDDIMEQAALNHRLKLENLERQDKRWGEKRQRIAQRAGGFGLRSVGTESKSIAGSQILAAQLLVPEFDTTWQEKAACRPGSSMAPSPDIFFPEKGGSTRLAKQVCDSCVVTSECLGYALARNETHGVWGGKSERERHSLKRAAS